MTLYDIAAILGYSIGIAAVVGLVSWKRTDPAYHPFIIVTTLAFINHITSLQMVRWFGANTVNANIFVFVESIIYVWQFQRWKLLKRSAMLFPMIMLGLAIIWVLDNLIVHRLTTLNSFFRIISSFLLVLLSIEQLNKLIWFSRKNLFVNSCFLICCGLLIYFSYKATIEVFFFIELKASIAFYTSIFAILIYLNFFVNLIFIWATVWIPRKQKFMSLP